MFYCEACRKRREWPESLSRSIGNCELCSTRALCYDRPSASLPAPPGAEDNSTSSFLAQMEATARYWLATNEESWREVTRAEFVVEERLAGHFNTTGGFSSSRHPVRGTVTYGETIPA